MASRSRTCFTCGQTGRTYAHFSFWADYPMELKWCEVCDLGWVVDLPQSEVFSDAYERVNALHYDRRTPEAIANGVKRAYLKGYRVAKQYLALQSDLPPRHSLRVLEVGSNIGAALQGVADCLGISTSQTTGVDFSENYAEFSQKRFGIPTHVETLKDAAGKISEAFDFVLCHHIIEHDENPSEFLSCLKKLTKPGGVISFELPNGKREATCIQLDERAGLQPYTLINHINYFSPRGFGTFLEKNGFQVQHLCTLNANNVMHDYGIWRKKTGYASAAPRLSDVPKKSLIDSIPAGAVDLGLSKAKQQRDIAAFSHANLRLHFPPSLPLGRDIEAFARRPISSI